jgi:hypothetical protein
VCSSISLPVISPLLINIKLVRGEFEEEALGGLAAELSEFGAEDNADSKGAE